MGEACGAHGSEALRATVVSRLSRNISYLVSSEIARRIFGFFSVAYMARVLAVEGFGQVMIGLTVLSYVALAGSAGLHVLGTRSVARGEPGAEPGSILTARLVNTVVAYLFAGTVTVVFVGHPGLRDVILISASSAFLHAMFLEWYFQGKETMMPNAIARTLGAFVYLVALLVVVRSPADIRLAACAAVVGDIASTGFLLGRFRGLGERLRFRLTFGMWRDLMVRAVPFGAGSVLGHVSVNLPILLVGALLGSAEAGMFSAASKLVFFLLMIDRILGTVLLPASVRLHAYSPTVLHAGLSDALRWILIVGMPLCFGGLVLGPDLIELVYGAEFSAAGPLFPIMVWFVLLTLLHTVYTSGVIASGRDADYRNVMILSAVLYAACLTAGIVWGELFGASTGMVVAEGLTVLLMRRAMHRTVPSIRPGRFGRIVLSTLGMGAVLLILPDMHPILHVSIGGVTYVVATFLFKAVSFGEYRSLIGRLT